MQDRRAGARWWRGAAVIAVSGALVLSGCTKNTDTTGPTTQTTAAKAAKVDDIANTVPEEIKSSGKLVVGVNVPYTPNEFKDSSGKIIGFDVDLMNAIASTLGLTTDYREADFAKIIPSIQGGTFNVGMSSFTDTKEREQTVDFVTYFSAGSLWAKPQGSTIDPNNACGLKVAVETGTVEETDDVPGKSKACTDAGKAAIQILKYDGQDQATNAVIQGQADATSADSPITDYAIAQSKGALQAAGKSFEVAPYGFAVDKGSKLAQALQKALQAMVDDGSYKKILDKWGVADGGLSEITINAASKS